MKEMSDHSELIDRSPVGSFQVRILLTCFAVAFFDGYDTQAIGYVAPLLAAATKAPLASFGLAFSSGLAGAAIAPLPSAGSPIASDGGGRWWFPAPCSPSSTS